MAKVKKGNMFETAAEQREQEQAKIATAVTSGQTVEAKRVGRPAGILKRKVTFAISEEDHQALKRYAVDQRTTVSDLIHEWIAEKCL